MNRNKLIEALSLNVYNQFLMDSVYPLFTENHAEVFMNLPKEKREDGYFYDLSSYFFVFLVAFMNELHEGKYYVERLLLSSFYPSMTDETFMRIVFLNINTQNYFFNYEVDYDGEKVVVEYPAFMRVDIEKEIERFKNGNI